MNRNYDEFFQAATAREHQSGFRPFPYQHRLGTEPFPTLLDVPTGLGKTAAVVVAWLYKRLNLPQETPRRLVYTLPQRSLVEQTYREACRWVDNTGEFFSSTEIPTVNMLMGGEIDLDWVESPERPAIVVGTQDMLLSRALMRGYGMSRYQWPIHFAFIHNDAFWVFDETQLMGVAVETSAQLQAFRREFGTEGSCRTMWMSATLGDEQLDTVDHRRPDDGWRRLTIGDADRDQSVVRRRLEASKAFQPAAEATVPRLKGDNQKYIRNLADEVAEHHVDDTLTLVIVNRVGRARQIYEALLKRHDGRDESNTALLHSRFRRPDRERHERLLHGEGDRIVVSTQVVEAGVDVSAQTMFTELAPWPSLVQRFGRCNRRGEQEDAQIFWIDVEYSTSARTNWGVLPYDIDAIERARQIVDELDDVGPRSVDKIPYENPSRIRPVLRRKDLLELFDTTADLSGHDIDVSRYIRDDTDTDVQFFWRTWETDDGAPPDDFDRPHRDELCRVSIGAAADFVKKDSVTAWRWDALDGTWRRVDRAVPGQTIVLDAGDGGYEPSKGWTGKKFRGKKSVSLIEIKEERSPESYDDNEETDVDQWVSLTEHLMHVGETVGDVAEALDLDDDNTTILREAAHWHDVGKAHDAFQTMLLDPVENDDDIAAPEGDGPWAKSNHRRGTPGRKYFRHELASALAYLQLHDGEPNADLVAYLVASHHGKVRLSIRSLPDEDKPHKSDATQHRELFARGIWHGDELPALNVPEAGNVGPVHLDLTPMRLGTGSWLDRMISVRDRFGPFRLAALEALLRIADYRASAAERSSARQEQEERSSANSPT